MNNKNINNKIYIFYQEFEKSNIDNSLSIFLKEEKFVNLENHFLPLKSFKNKFLSSKYDPEKEANRLKQQISNLNNNLIVFFQINNLFYIKKLLEIENYKDFLIIEFSDKILKILQKYFPENIDITYNNKSEFITKIKDNYNNKNIIFLINPDKEILKQTLFAIERDEVYKIQSNRNILQYFDKVNTIFDSMLNQKKINSQTISKFGYQWIKNSLINLEKYIFNKGVKLFFNFAKGLNILVIGGGPSLYYNIENIKKIYPYTLIIAVDTALRPLLKNKIVPDFIVSFDSQSINSAYILTTNHSSSILLTVPTVNPILLEKYSGKIVFSSIFFDFIQKIDELTYPKFEILSGGTVTSSAYDFAKMMNPDNIFFLGLDLCYSYNQNHSKNALYEDLFYYFQNYLLPYEKLFLTPILNGTTYLTYDLANRVVRSDLKFKMFADWFSSEIDSNTFFLTDRILKVDNFKFKNFNNILTQINNKDKIKKQIEKKRKFIKDLDVNVEIKKDKLNSLKKYFLNLNRELEELSNIFMSARNLSLQLEEFNKKNLNIDNFLYNLELFEKKIKEYNLGLHIINLASQKLFKQIQHDFKNNKTKEEIIIENIMFYTTMLNLSKKILKVLKKTIKSFDKFI